MIYMHLQYIENGRKTDFSYLLTSVLVRSSNLDANTDWEFNPITEHGTMELH